MEAPEIILEKALSSLNNSSVNEELNSLLQKLESKDVKEILQIDKNDDLRQINNDIYALCIPNGKIECEKISEFIFTEQSYLKRGIENADVKLILIFLYVNCYLKIDLKNLLIELELTEDSRRLISDKIIEFLQRINLDVKVLPDAPYHEIEIMKKFEQGIVDSDIKSTYQFIESIERGGRGFYFNFLLEHFISFLYQLDYSCFLRYISKIESPQNLVFHLQNFKVEQLLRLSDAPSLTSKWLNFELIRQIIQKEQSDGFEEVECIAIKNILTKIDANDFVFLKQTVQYFHKSKLFNAALGELLISFTGYRMQELLSDCFVIDRYSNSHEARNKILERFDNNATKCQRRILLEMIYNKWNLYFTGLLNSDDFYLNDILLTDFCDFIVLYYIQFTSKEYIVTQMSETIKQLIWIESQWFASESKELTTFHLLYSKLYLLSFAYKGIELKDASITALFSKIICTNVLLCRYFEGDVIQSLIIIDKNLNQ